MTNRRKRYIAGVVSGTSVTVLGAAVGLWLTPFALRFLNSEEYALFVLAQDTLLWLVLADFGITGALIVKASQAKGRNSEEETAQLASTAFAAQSVLAGLVLAAGTVLSFVFTRFFELSPDLAAQGRGIMLILTVATAASVFAKTFSAVIVSQQRVDLDNAIKLIGAFLRAGGIAALLLLGFGLQAMAWGNLVASLAGAAASYFVVRVSLRQVRLGYRLASRETLRGMLGLGFWFFVNSIAFVVLRSFDRIITAKVISISAVATLTLTGRMYGLFQEIVLQVARVALPFLGESAGRGSSGELLERHHVFARVALLLSTIGSAGLWAANGVFVSRWVGEQYYAGPFVDFMLAAQCILFAYVYSYRNTLSASLVVRPQALLRIAEGGLLIVLCLFLGRAFGLEGVVLGKTLASALTAALFMPVLARTVKTSALRLAAKDISEILKAVGSAIPGALLGRWVGLRLTGFPGAIAAATIGTGIGSVLAFYICLEQSQRDRVFTELRAAIERARHRVAPNKQAI